MKEAQPRKRRRGPRTRAHEALRREAGKDYEGLLAAQKGVCAICGREPRPTRRLDIDHDHKTMLVRGLLCHRCNRGLPRWVTPEWLRRAADYLEGAWG